MQARPRRINRPFWYWVLLATLTSWNDMPLVAVVAEKDTNGEPCGTCMMATSGAAEE